jgi:phosphoglycolate phosphatase-like HAD superfamily hydrolase
MSAPERSTALAHRPEVTTVLWDLDGTLVGLRRRTFGVLMPLVAAAAFTGLIPPWRFLALLKDILPQVRANTGRETNHELLVRLIAEQLGVGDAIIDARLRRLAGSGFPLLQRCFYPQPGAPELVGELATRGLRQVIATNPLWPLDTVLARLAWGRIDATRFTFIASGESMCRSKPQVDYYRELLGLLGAHPRECVMIGNDARNDGAASVLGIPVYLLKATNSFDCGAGTNPTLVTAGDWPALKAWLGVEEDACSSC